MTRSLLLIVTGAVLALAGCNPIYVNHDYDKDADFQSYKTFTWLTLPPDATKATSLKGPSQLEVKRILSNIKAELVAKGITESDKDGDLLVNFYTASQEITEINKNMYTGADLYASAMVGGGGATVTNVTEGTLVIDLIDARTDRLVWRGTAEAAMDESKTTQEDRYDVLDNAIAKVFENYPPEE